MSRALHSFLLTLAGVAGTGLQLLGLGAMLLAIAALPLCYPDPVWPLVMIFGGFFAGIAGTWLLQWAVDAITLHRRPSA